jgi:ribosomal protein S18 acetylase RimI-like enzyme
MSDVTWRAATAEDAGGLAGLFGVVARTSPIGLETELAQVQARLSMPRLDLSRDTRLAVDSEGGVVAYVEAADMGVAEGRMRIRLTIAAHSDLDDGAARRTHQWLLERAMRLHTERHPELPGVLGARCAATDAAGLSRLTESGFTVANRHDDLVRPVEPPMPLSHPPAGVVIENFDRRLDVAAWKAHNDAYADMPGALLPDIQSWPQHATGLDNFLADASFLAVVGDPADPAIAAFLFSLEQRDHTGAREASLHCVGTRRPWRRRGLATALVSHAMAAYQQAGLIRARLQVTASNTAAANLYRRLGFIDSGRGYTILHRAIP